MSYAKREAPGRPGASAYAIGPKNPCTGRRLRVRWLRPWGGKPAGFEAEGILLATFCVNGRTCIGELKIETGNGWRKLSCPWSRNYLEIEEG